MKTAIKTSIGGPFLRPYFVLTAIALGLLALSPRMQAVTPAPDGGYPNFTTAEGQNALFSATTGQGNTAVGWYSLWANAPGEFNTAIGAGALLFNNGDPTAGEAIGNTAFGAAELLFNTTGGSNTAVGAGALAGNTDGEQNVAIGDHTLMNNVSGFHNTVVGGGGAGFNIVNGSNNIYIGRGVSANGSFDESDTIRIRDSAPAAAGATSKVFFTGIDGSTVGAVNAPVLINPNGQLGTGVSSARFKKDIDAMGTTSEVMFSLEPVTFHHKGDTTNTPQFGLIAEEVAEINPALIRADKEGKPYSVRYDQVNAMLLSEFLKEHKTVQELKNEIAELTATVKEQAAEIQKVSVRVELNEPRSWTVLNSDDQP